MQVQVSVPFDRELIEEVLAKYRIRTEAASIREMSLIVGEVESRLSCRYLHMEMGVPGLEPPALGVEAEVEALRTPRVVPTYAPLAGIPPLKAEASRFVELFLDVKIPPQGAVPTVGSMQGGFLAQAVCGRARPERDRILFVDPCFSVHRMQTRFLGLRDASVDLYDREHWLERVEETCRAGDVAAILYSSPNNPTWVILTEGELKRLGEICTKYDVIAIEDAAYLGMDFRRDYGKPGVPPFIPTVAKFTENFIFLLSASKIFSYAGQRAALAFIPPALGGRTFPGLMKWFGQETFFNAFVMNALYCTTASVPQSQQHAMAAMLKAASDGKYDFLGEVAEYARRAAFMRRVMTENGFSIVYDRDHGGEPLSDGFYFTFAYKGMDGGALIKELLVYGISATALTITKSCRTEAVRACTSMIGEKDFPLFEERIRAFCRDHRP